MSIGKRPHKIDVQYDGTKNLTTELKNGNVEIYTSEESIDYKSAVNIQDPKMLIPILAGCILLKILPEIS